MCFVNADVGDRSDVVVDNTTLLLLMTNLAKVCHLSHYQKQLPPIAKAGMYLDLFVNNFCKES